jgi:hypothetical protein
MPKKITKESTKKNVRKELQDNLLAKLTAAVADHKGTVPEKKWIAQLKKTARHLAKEIAVATKKAAAKKPAKKVKTEKK